MIRVQSPERQMHTTTKDLHPRVSTSTTVITMKVFLLVAFAVAALTEGTKIRGYQSYTKEVRDDGKMIGNENRLLAGFCCLAAS